MKPIALFLTLSAAVLAGCESAPDPAPAESTEPAQEIAAASFEMDDGTCDRCNVAVYSNHVCGRTVPCAMCKAEAGPQHRHSLVWGCAPCERTYTATHVCNNARTCPT